MKRYFKHSHKGVYIPAVVTNKGFVIFTDDNGRGETTIGLDLFLDKYTEVPPTEVKILLREGVLG